MPILLWVSAVDVDQPCRFQMVKELNDVFTDVVLRLWLGSLRFVFFLLNIQHRSFRVGLATFLWVRFGSSSNWFFCIFGVLL